MEEELGRPVSFAEVFKKTHTLPDCSYVDQKAKQVYEDYGRTLQDVMDQPGGDRPENSESSEHSTQRQLTIDEQNDLFLKCTYIDPKGNPYGMGQLSLTVNKGKRKISYPSSSGSFFEEMQDELKAARQKIDGFEEANKRQNEADQRRDAELKQSQAKITEFEKLVMFLKNEDPRITAYMSLPPVTENYCTN